MLKKDLYKKLKEEFPYLKAVTIKGAIDAIFEEITQGLVDRNPTVLRGIGTFTTEERKMPKENFKTFNTGHTKETFIAVKYYPSIGLKKRIKDNV